MLMPSHRTSNVSSLGSLLLLVTLTIHAVSAVGVGHEGADHEHPHQERPRVLLLGDSISMGYTPWVKQQLSDIAEVQRPKANCGPTTRGLLRLDEWLGDEAWDVIHFNFGLHDLKYVAEGEQLVAVDQGKQQVPIQQYAANLRTIAKRLRSTGAKPSWCTTTPVPTGAKGRVPGDSQNTMWPLIMPCNRCSAKTL